MYNNNNYKYNNNIYYRSNIISFNHALLYILYWITRSSQKKQYYKNAWPIGAEYNTNSIYNFIVHSIVYMIICISNIICNSLRGRPETYSITVTKLSTSCSSCSDINTANSCPNLCIIIIIMIIIIIIL